MFRLISARLGVAAMLVAGIALAGCGGSSKSTDPAPQYTPMNQQTAQSVAQILVLSINQDLSGALGGGNPYGAGRTPLIDGAMSAQVANQDTSITIDGLTYWFSVQFFDAGGNEQSKYDSMTTARVVVADRVSGMVSDPGFTMTVGSTGLADIIGTDAASDTLTTSGLGSDTLSVHIVDQQQQNYYMHMLGAMVMDRVKQLKPVEHHQWPLSGTMAWTVRLDMADNPSFNPGASYLAHALVTFNGTKDVEIVFQEGFHFMGDLEAGTVQPI